MIEQVTAAFSKDPSPVKLNLGVGVYRAEVSLSLSLSLFICLCDLFLLERIKGACHSMDLIYSIH